MIRNGYGDTNGNSVVLGEKGETHDAKLVFLQNNALLKIGDGASISNLRIELGKNALLEIGPFSRVRGQIFVGAYSAVKIGKSCELTQNIMIRAVEKTTVSIGDDCLFGKNVKIRSSDGHPIYDRSCKERINFSRDVQIGHHVWVGEEAVILKGCEIGNGCIIGLRAVVTKEVPSFCAAAGVPARIIRREVTWEHTNGIFTDWLYE